MSTVSSLPDYQQVFQALPGNYLLLAPDGVVVECSAGFAAAAGHPRHAFVGTSLIQTLALTPDLPATLPDLATQVQQTRQPQTLLFPAAPQADNPHARKQLTFSPLLDAQGQLLYILQTVEPAFEAPQPSSPALPAPLPVADIPALYQQPHLEQALLESEQYFRVMADKVPVMIWVTRPDGHCVYLNEQWYAYSGQPEAEALGYGWLDAVHPDETRKAGAVFRDANARQVPFNFEYRLRGKDGTYRWFVDKGQPKFNASGEYEGLVGSVVDIHERKMAEQALRLASQKLAATNKELRAANQQSQLTNAELAETNNQLTRINQDLDNFVYTASHDLRQPVNNLAGVFEELKRSATFHDPEAEQLVSMFESALHQIHSTIQGLAEVVHVERRHDQLPPEPVALLELAHGVIQSIQSQANAVQADFQLDFSAVPTVRFARLNLQSILYNLLSNALKYAHPQRPPLIRIASELAPDGTPVLLVQDNGLGLDLARYGNDLFKMFRRFHDHVTGSGMGLYLVNRIVQQAGGHINVESALDVGTIFRVHLPKAR